MVGTSRAGKRSNWYTIRMHKPILVANWKNHPDSLEQAKFILKGLSRKSAIYKKLGTFIAPPHTYFESVSKLSKNFSHLASQDISLEQKTCTSLVSVEILKSFGVRLAIIGHSERRALGESDETVSKKIKWVLRAGITPLLCVGEHEHDAEGEHLEFLQEELKNSLASLRRHDLLGKLMIAYEPIWAIGKRAKDAMQPNDLSHMVIFIRKVLSDLFGREVALKTPILYGGSVAPSNAEVLMSTGISGFLVGHESLDSKNFGEIAESLNK